MAEKPSYKQLEQQILQLRQQATEHDLSLISLAQNEQLFRRILNQASEVVVVAQDGMLKVFNKKALEITGATEDELSSRPFIEFVHPDDRDIVMERYLKRLAGEDVGKKYYIFRVVDKNGDSRYLETTGTPTDWKGKPATIHFMTEVTKRKQAEELVYTQRDLAIAMGSSNDIKKAMALLLETVLHLDGVDCGGVYLVDPATKNLEVIVHQGLSQKFVKAVASIEADSPQARLVMEGKPVRIQYDSFLKEPGLESLDEPDSPREREGKLSRIKYSSLLEKPDHALRDDEGLRSVLIFPVKHGDKVVAALNMASKGHAKISSAILNAIETLTAQMGGVIARVRAETQLRASEEKYRHLVENATDAIAIIQDQTVKFVNPAALSMFGYSPAEMSAGKFTDAIHPDHRDMALENHLSRLAGKTAPNTYTFNMLAKSGRNIAVQLNAARISWEGRPAILAMIRDVTEAKKLEEQLQHAQRMEAIGTLAGGVAHDFNNLLMAIQGNTSLVLLGTAPDSSSYKKLKNIERCVQSGAKLTRQLLGYAKGGKYEVLPTDINQVVSNSAIMFGRAKKEIHIHENLYDDLWSAEVDRVQIEQVLLNLFVNAWQAMSHGGDLYLETKNAVITQPQAIALKIASGDYVKITVTDTGVGMDEATKNRIFEPFFSTRTMGGGTGLGLASAYGIIKNHGGFINVHSKKGKGATFEVFLPASKKEARSGLEYTAQLHYGQGAILLTDDEQMVLEVGEEMLKKLGYDVICASSGKEAIELFTQNKDKIKVVILDVVMPDMGGGETFERIKEAAPGVKVLLSSGYSADGQAESLLAAGCHGFIQKPFDLVELAEKLRSIMAD